MRHFGLSTAAIEVALATLLFIVVSVLTARTQSPLTYHDGLGWDGVEYFAVAAQLAAGERPRAEAPFVSRIGTPALAVLFDRGDLRNGFRRANLLANAIVVVLLVVWLRLYVGDPRVRLAMVALYVTAWHGPTRFVFFYPVYVDPWLMVFLLAGWVIVGRDARISSRRTAALTIVTAIGALFRETSLLIALAYPLVGNPFRGPGRGVLIDIEAVARRMTPSSLVPLAAGLLTSMAVRSMVVATNDFSLVATVFSWAQRKSPLSFVHGLLIALGPAVLVLLVLEARATWATLTRRQEWLVYLLAVGALSWVGGADTERIALWSTPITLVLTAKVIETRRTTLSRHPLAATLLVIAQLVSWRVLWSLPDHPNVAATPMPWLTILANDFRYFDLYSFHAQRWVAWASLTQYVGVIGALVAWFRRDWPDGANTDNAEL